MDYMDTYVMVGDKIYKFIIFGLTIGLFIFGIYIFLKIRNIKKNINKLEKEHPELKEKIRISKSKNVYYIEKNKEKNKGKNSKAIFVIVTMIIFIVIANILKLNQRIIVWVLIIGLIVYLKFIYTRAKQEEKNFKQYIENTIQTKYGMFKKEMTAPPKIIYGNKTEVGNIRKVNVFSYKIFKYKCILNNSYQEQLVKELENTSSSSYYTYRYKKIINMFEYYYNLEALGLKNISESILEQESVKTVINELSKIKIIRVTIKGKYLLIEKETVLHNYEEQDADRDISDVGLFYNKIVKTILESE